MAGGFLMDPAASRIRWVEASPCLKCVSHKYVLSGPRSKSSVNAAKHTAWVAKCSLCISCTWNGPTCHLSSLQNDELSVKEHPYPELFRPLWRSCDNARHVGPPLTTGRVHMWALKMPWILLCASCMMVSISLALTSSEKGPPPPGAGREPSHDEAEAICTSVSWGSPKLCVHGGKAPNYSIRKSH